MTLRKVLMTKKGSDDSNDQSTEDGEINDTSDILIISVDSNDTSIISDDSEKGSDNSKDQKIEDGEINDTNDTSKVSDNPDDQTKETQSPT